MIHLRLLLLLLIIIVFININIFASLYVTTNVLLYVCPPIPYLHVSDFFVGV